MVFPSPHSGILFLSVVVDDSSCGDFGGFRPLIRGFFFYAPKTKPIRERRVGGVSVPSFGDSFFILSL